MSLDQVKALASLPSREVLLSQLLGTMQAPIATFVRTLNEVPTKFVRALAAVRDAKQAA
jgi:large subunit ribosomal protein L10